MMIRSYLQWSQTATAADRAEAASILCRVYLAGEISAEERREAVAALTFALDDSSPLVRLAIARALGGAETAPRHIIIALAQGRCAAANVVLANSPSLLDDELIDCVEQGDGQRRQAIASRPYVSPAVCGALAAHADVDTLIQLLDNPGAEVPETAIRAMVDRHRDDGALREAVLRHPDIPTTLKMLLVQYAADHLSRFVVERGWMSDVHADQLHREGADAGIATVASYGDEADVSEIVEELVRANRLTPQLLLRSLLCAEDTLFVAAVAHLAQLPHDRAANFLHGRGGVGFRAVYQKAGLPSGLEIVFEQALGNARKQLADRPESRGELSRPLVEQLLISMSSMPAAQTGRLISLLARYQAEAARLEARVAIEAMRVVEESVVMPQAAELEERLEEALALEFRKAA
jgi:uncharacterized protein (DUF2336 family)